MSPATPTSPVPHFHPAHAGIFAALINIGVCFYYIAFSLALLVEAIMHLVLVLAVPAGKIVRLKMRPRLELSPAMHANLRLAAVEEVAEGAVEEAAAALGDTPGSLPSLESGSSTDPAAERFGTPDIPAIVLDSSSVTESPSLASQLLDLVHSPFSALAHYSPQESKQLVLDKVVPIGPYTPSPVQDPPSVE